MKKKSKDQKGFVLIFVSFLVLIFLVWGMLVIKTEQNYSFRADLNVELLSTFNAASNAGPQSERMFEVACYQLGRTFSMVPAAGTDVDNCDSTGFTPSSAGVPVIKNYTNVSFLDGSVKCNNIKFKFDPGFINQTTLRQKEFCIDLSGCETQSNFLIPLVSSEPYLFGASGCTGLKPAAVMVLVDNSRKMFRNYQGPNGFDMPPPVFLHSSSGYVSEPTSDFTSTHEASMVLNSLPMVFDSPLPAYPPRFTQSPKQPYSYPFSTKEYTLSGAIPNQYAGSGQSLPPNVERPAFFGSMPNVVPQTATAPTSTGVRASPTITNDPDPIQYMSLMTGGRSTEQWATSGNTALPDMNFPWRHGVMTMNELANRCFNQRKLWTNRIAQQTMYMLEWYGIPFGAAMYSNWIQGLMPYIPYSHRYHPSWPIADRASTLDIPVLGPDENDLIALPGGNPQYFEKQFGNFGNLATVPGGLLDKATNFRLVFQPNTLCAREMGHEIVPGALVGGPIVNAPHVFTAQADPYDFTRTVTANNTVCADTAAHTVPTIEAVPNYSFIFRSELDGVTDDSPPPSAPSATIFDAGDCYGDEALGNSDTLEGFLPRSYCGSQQKFGMPGWMRRDAGDITPSLQRNIDNVLLPSPPAVIGNPYRICPNPVEMETTLSSMNVAVAMSSIGAGGFKKSGWPMNIGTAPSGDLGGSFERQRYFTPVNSWGAASPTRVYPEHEPTSDDFTPGAILNSYNILTDPSWIPDPSILRRIVILFSNGSSNLSVRQALQGQMHSAWFQADPPPSVLPTGTDVNVTPFTTAIKESLQLIHKMAEEGFIVIVVTLQDPTADAQVSQVQQFFSYGLRPPIGKAPPSNTSYAYALCRPCGVMSISDGNPLAGEPTVDDPANACFCHTKNTAKNVHEIKVTRALNETWPQYQTRMFRRVAIDINRILNEFTQTK
ncbi:MAG: hypothetical protein SGJ02_05945 [bacterium]|nr:hypothetical protein [bacterium]